VQNHKEWISEMCVLHSITSFH